MFYCLLALVSLIALACAAPGLRSEDPWSGDSWHKYVRSPGSDIVKSVRILSENTIGDVSNPDGMIGGDKTTVLTRENGDENAPTVVVYFGLNVVGLLSITFDGSRSPSDGLPGLRLAFSETKEGLTDKSDYTRSYRRIHDEDRLTNGTDQIAVKNEKYTWVDKLGCQHDRPVCADDLHGFRYVKIWLDALETDAPHISPAGSVSISAVDLEWSAYLGIVETFTGWFECSDEDFTQWWFDGVYTVDTNTDLFFKSETEPRNAYSPTLDGKWVLHDGAKRDRDPYIGDLTIASVTSYLSHNFPDPSYNVLETHRRFRRQENHR